MTKKIVYFNEYNLLMGSGGVSYLPFVSGILSANAKKIKKIKDNFKFKQFIFKPDTAENLINQYYDEKPDIAVFSISMWNEQLSLKVADQLKKKWNTLIVFGGASTPHNPTDYFKKYPFIDIAVRAEGEEAFNEILLGYLNNKNFKDIPNVSFRSHDNKCILNPSKTNFSKDLDMYPSPYLSGEYDYLFKDNEDHKYQVIVETNRGCPFLCTYCYWGKGGTTTKYRFHSLERVFKEIEWIAEKKIQYVFNADSNFGMHRRDIEIANKLVEVKKRTGYPDKFRTCWGKNTSEQIYKIASLLHLHGLEKGITLARQTNSKEALKAVKRDNIKLEAYSELEKKFNQLQIPVYAEMILGLPEETYKSWTDGLGYLLDTSINNQIFVYQAEVYPNTEMNEPSYRKKHGIKTTKIELQEIHCSPREQTWLKEIQEIVTETSTMSTKDWQDKNLFSTILMFLHSFKTGYYILVYLMNEFEIKGKDLIEFMTKNINSKETPFIYKNLIKKTNDWTNNILKGQGRGNYVPEFSDVFLDIEEVVFIEMSKDWNLFYKEFEIILKNFLGEKRFLDNYQIIKELIEYQKLRMPCLNSKQKKVDFKYNIAEYLFRINSEKRVKLKKSKNSISTVNVTTFKDLPEFTQKQIIWGRKSDKIKYDIDYDLKELEKELEAEKMKIDNFDADNQFKINLFDKQNKFEKYSSLDLKNNRRLQE